MESNDKLKEISVKNCTCYYFDEVIKFEDFVLDFNLIDEKLYKNTLVYNISYKTLMCVKRLRIRFCKIDGLIRVYDGTRYNLIKI